MNILFFGRKSDPYSIKLSKILKKKHSVKIIWSDGKKNKVDFKIKEIFDCIICFRSNYILTGNIIKKAKFAAINFHPGPPKYRGIGCTNLALLNNVKTYGSTAHLINTKIDAGKILDVSKFKVSTSDDLKAVLKKTHKIMFYQAKKILMKILSDKKNLKKFLQKNQNIKWSKNLMTRKKLDDLYKIKLPISEKSFLNKVRALQFKHFRLIINTKKGDFIINQND
jgi:methionyl-tRNA formyltransferase